MSTPYDELSLKLAELVAEQIKSQPASNLALPTGRTPLGAYQVLVRQAQAGQSLDWSKINCFALDEYVDSHEKDSYKYFLEQQLFQYTNLPKTSRHFPDSVDDYDGLIASLGGLDLTVLGIGKNGHIAFNEPGTELDSYTHSIWLTECTRKANQDLFASADQVPTRAVTVGIRTILASRHIILVASGEGKRAIVEKALHGPVTPQVPASFLKLHPHVTVLTDFGDFS